MTSFILHDFSHLINKAPNEMPEIILTIDFLSLEVRLHSAVGTLPTEPFISFLFFFLSFGAFWAILVVLVGLSGKMMQNASGIIENGGLYVKDVKRIKNAKNKFKSIFVSFCVFLGLLGRRECQKRTGCLIWRWMHHFQSLLVSGHFSEVN